MNNTEANRRRHHGMAIPCLLLVLFAVSSRLLPHLPNMTAVGALGLYAGAVLPGNSRWLAPLAALLISDAVLGYYDLSLMLFVYCASLAAIPCARFTVVSACLAAAVAFFIISNFGVWLTTGMYPPTLYGLYTCYVAALPFLVYSVAGNLFYYPAMLYGTRLLEGLLEDKAAT